MHDKITQIWLLLFLYNLLVSSNKNQVEYIFWILLEVTIIFLEV